MKQHTYWLGISMLVLFLSACYEPTEGCLDTRATNFDLDADGPCPDCCTYPELSLRFDNVWSYADTTVAFRTDTFYHDIQNHPFYFERIRFYWSNLRLQRTNGDVIRLEDSLDISIAELGDTSMTTILDDIVLADITSSSRTVQLGTLTPEGMLLGLRATFGINDPTNKAVTTSVSTSHPLAPQAGQMNFGSDLGYVFAKIEYLTDTIAAADTMSINLYGSDFIRELSLDLPTPMTFIDGFDPTLVIQQDIARWFEGIDVRSTDTTALKNQFVQNLTQSLQLMDLLAE